MPTVRLRAPESPPPGPGVNTVTLRLPGEARSEAGIAAVSWFVLVKPVARSAPSRRTTEQGVKSEPLTVSVKAGSPACFELGSISAAAGAGRTEVTAKLLPPEVWAFVITISRSAEPTRVCELPPAPGTASTAEPPGGGVTTTS